MSWLRSRGSSQAKTRTPVSWCQAGLFLLSLCLEGLFAQISSATFSRLRVCIQSVLRQAVREERVCVCSYVHIHQSPTGHQGPLHTRPRTCTEAKKQVWEQQTDSRSGFRGPLFAVRINLGLLQRPELGLHFRFEALTFKKLQSKWTWVSQ